jgi:hypothetical protein
MLTADAFGVLPPVAAMNPEQAIDDTLEVNLNALTRRYAEVVVSHELAEALEDVPEWPDILSCLGDRHAEYYLRTLKDSIADLSVSGPLSRIIGERDDAALALCRPCGTIHLYAMVGEEGALAPVIREKGCRILGERVVHTYSPAEWLAVYDLEAG